MNPFVNLSRPRLRALLDPFAKVKDARQGLEDYVSAARGFLPGVRHERRQCWRWQPNVRSSLKADAPLRCGELTKWGQNQLMRSNMADAPLEVINDSAVRLKAASIRQELG